MTGGALRCLASADQDLDASMLRTDTRTEASQTAEILEALDSLALHFGCIDVAFAVNGEVMQVHELAQIGADAARGRHLHTVRATQHVELAVGVVGCDEV